MVILEPMERRLFVTFVVDADDEWEVFRTIGTTGGVEVIAGAVDATVGVTVVFVFDGEGDVCVEGGFGEIYPPEAAVAAAEADNTDERPGRIGGLPAIPALLFVVPTVGDGVVILGDGLLDEDTSLNP